MAYITQARNKDGTGDGEEDGYPSDPNSHDGCIHVVHLCVICRASEGGREGHRRKRGAEGIDVWEMLSQAIKTDSEFTAVKLDRGALKQRPGGVTDGFCMSPFLFRLALATRHELCDSSHPYYLPPGEPYRR